MPCLHRFSHFHGTSCRRFQVVQMNTNIAFLSEADASWNSWFGGFVLQIQACNQKQLGNAARYEINNSRYGRTICKSGDIDGGRTRGVIRIDAALSTLVSFSRQLLLRSVRPFNVTLRWKTMPGSCLINKCRILLDGINGRNNRRQHRATQALKKFQPNKRRK